MIKGIKVHYSDNLFEDHHFTSCSLNSVFLQAIQSNVNQHFRFFFGIICGEHQSQIISISKNNSLLEIIISGSFESDKKQKFHFPLNISKRMLDLAVALFSIYSNNNEDLSPSTLIELLIEATLKANSHILTTQDSYLTLLQFMNDNTHQSLTTKQLCSAVHLSKSSLNDLCDKISGLSPIKLFRHIQCCKATQLLRDTDLTIQEISNSLGFQNSGHFSTTFKRITGNTPQKIRQNQFDYYGGFSYEPKR